VCECGTQEQGCNRITFVFEREKQYRSTHCSRLFFPEEKGLFSFLKSCIPSIVVTYWNPPSMSFVASFAVVALTQVF
jgi:hypothetical protein